MPVNVLIILEFFAGRSEWPHMGGAGHIRCWRRLREGTRTRYPHE